MRTVRTDIVTPARRSWLRIWLGPNPGYLFPSAKTRASRSFLAGVWSARGSERCFCCMAFSWMRAHSYKEKRETPVFLCVSATPSCCTNAKAAAFSDGVYRRATFLPVSRFGGSEVEGFCSSGGTGSLASFALLFSRHRHAVTVPGGSPLRFAASSGPSSCAKRRISVRCCAVHFAAIFPSSKTAF
jgi:hypothetical protein